MNDPFATFVAQAEAMHHAPVKRKQPWESAGSLNVLKWLRKLGKPATALQLAQALKVTRTAAKERLIVLRRGGLVVYRRQEGKRTTENSGEWHLTEKGLNGQSTT